MKLKTLSTCLTIILLSSAFSAWAVDTTETFEVGFTDFEIYAMAGGIGEDRETTTTGSEMVFGVGLNDRLSATLSVAFEANTYFANGATGLGAGLFATVRDGDRIDFDLMLGIGQAGPDFSELEVAPGFELNYDNDPEQGGWGLYCASSLVLHHHQAETNAEEHRLAMDLPATLGLYQSLAGGSQVFLAFDVCFHDIAENGEFGEGSLALGYNIPLSASMELITEYSLLLHETDDHEWHARNSGLSLGLISTLP